MLADARLRSGTPKRKHSWVSRIWGGRDMLDSYRAATVKRSVEDQAGDIFANTRVSETHGVVVCTVFVLMLALPHFDRFCFLVCSTVHLLI